MKVIPTKFSASFINNTFYSEEVAHKDLQSINYGQCYDWSWLSYLCWSNRVQLWSSENHAFVKVNGLFYDSEAVDGVCDWRLLRTCRDLNNEFGDRFYDTRDFIYEWADEKHFRKLERKCWKKVSR